MKQMLLFPDPRPLVDRLGREFFRQVPPSPGVYLMRDAADTVLYVGKAKNLRRRLGSYRVANPDRMRQRHLRLLCAVMRIEWEHCTDEAAALVREAELLRSLKPRFNRAGTWPAPTRFLVWQMTDEGMALGLTATPEPGWQVFGPMGAGGVYFRAALARLLWCAIHPQQGSAGLPSGWVHGHLGDVVTIAHGSSAVSLAEVAANSCRLCAGDSEPFCRWIRERTGELTHPFERAAVEADLELVGRFR